MSETELTPNHSKYYKPGDIVEILNTRDYCAGMSKHHISRNKYHDIDDYKPSKGERFRVNSTDSDTVYFEGGGSAAPSSIMLIKRAE